mmetsp:Transcript_13770/g.18918  ORF Transcript_13770/g.18918 Transcript_13770/m.18918 type:complete len:214 (-) Transcript_13770:1432-2073(-)
MIPGQESTNRSLYIEGGVIMSCSVFRDARLIGESGQLVLDFSADLYLLIFREWEPSYPARQRMQCLIKVYLSVMVRDVNRHYDVLDVRLSGMICTTGAQRSIQLPNHGSEFARRNVIGGIGVQARPHVHKARHVVAAHSGGLTFTGLLEVLQDDSYHQVKHHKGADDDEDAEEDDGSHAIWVGRAVVVHTIIIRLRKPIQLGVAGGEVHVIVG